MRIDPAYYTVADGDGQTTRAREADVDVGGDRRLAHREGRLLISVANSAFAAGCQWAWSIPQ
jgi:hypothetical protein